MAMFGVDLSDFRLVSNFDLARPAVDFMITKATDGTEIVHGSYENNWRGFAGKPRGVYHYTECMNVAAEVAHFVSVWRKHPWEIDPILDAECKGINSAYIRTWIAEFRRQTGHQSIGVYSGLSLFQGACNPAGFVDSNVWLWVARYRKTGRPSNTGSGLNSYLGWWHPAVRIVQYDDDTGVPGIPQTVDANLAPSTVTTKTAASPTQAGGFLMALTDAQQLTLFNTVLRLAPGDGTPKAGNLAHPVGDAYLADLNWRKTVNANLAALQASVAALAKDSNVTADQLSKIINDAIAENVKITGTVEISGGA